MIKLLITIRYIALAVASVTLLSGCLGGTIAQQIARSIATSVADNVTAHAMDVDEDEDYSPAQYTAAANLSAQNNSAQRSALQGSGAINPASQNAINNANLRQQQINAFNNNPQDPYKIAFVNAVFSPVTVIAEPLPSELAEPEIQLNAAQTTQLVRVEIFNLLIGEEKAAVYEKARIMGSITLPKAREWKNWAVATGEVKSSNTPDKLQQKKLITFIIPPEFGKLPSGTIAVVELASAGELNIARYKAN